MPNNVYKINTKKEPANVVLLVLTQIIGHLSTFLLLKNKQLVIGNPL